MPAIPRSRARARAAVVPFPGVARVSRTRVAALVPSPRSLAAGAALAVLAIGAYVAARETSAFALRSVTVTGAPPPVARDVRKALAPLVGRSLVVLDGGEVNARVEALPVVVSARHDRAFPHTLVVAVTPEQPVSVVRRGAQAWLVSARGRVLRRLAARARPALPRVWVAKSVDPKPGGFVDGRSAIRAIRALAVADRSRFPLRIATVRTGRHELTLLLRSGLALRLGDEHDLPLKLAIAARIAPRLGAPVRGAAAYLDLELPERPVAAGVTFNSKVEVEG